MTSPNNIFITTCDGYTGAHIANHLAKLPLEHVASIKLGCTNKEDTHDLLEIEKLGAKHASVCEIDPSKADQLDKALKDCTVLCIIPPTRRHKFSEAKNFIAAAERAGVQRAVLVSFAGCTDADQKTHPHMAQFADLETAFNASKIANKIVARPGFYAQNLFLYADQIVNDKVLPAPTGQGKWAPVDLEMFGESVARMLACPDTIAKHKGQVLSFTGTELLSGTEMAKHLGEVMGTKVEFKDVSMQDAEKLIRGSKTKLDETEIQTLLESYDLIRNQKFNWTSDDAKKVLGDDFKLPSFKDTVQRCLPHMKQLAGGAK